MPTGYTGPVQEGKITDLAEFATLCAGAFGAFMHQREDHPNSPRTMPERYDHAERRLAEVRQEKAEWEAMNEEARYAEWSDYAREQEKLYHEAVAKRSLYRSRYEAMLAQVVSVDVPSTHQEFKNFMISQLEDSIGFDCGDGSFEKQYYKVQSYPEWCKTTEEMHSRYIAMYEDDARREQKRHNERLEYIRVLKDVFGVKVNE